MNEFTVNDYTSRDIMIDVFFVRKSFVTCIRYSRISAVLADAFCRSYKMHVLIIRRFWVALVSGFLLLYSACLNNLRIVGSENIPQSGGGIVVVEPYLRL